MGVIILKLLFKILAVFSLAAGESDGWYPVEQPKKAAEPREDDDASIWVLFSKKVGDETFLVRFPDDPRYRYFLDDGLWMQSMKEGAQYNLWVKKLKAESFQKRVEEVKAISENILLSVDEEKGDLLYRKGENWVWEHVKTTPAHLFLFQTVGNQKSAKNHQFFIDSLSVE